MKLRKVAVEQAYMLMGIPKIPKMPFRWNKKKCSRWARPEYGKK